MERQETVVGLIFIASIDVRPNFTLMKPAIVSVADATTGRILLDYLSYDMFKELIGVLSHETISYCDSIDFVRPLYFGMIGVLGIYLMIWPFLYKYQW